MKLDTLVDMAKETAAFGVHPSGEFIYSFYTEQLQAFAALVASAERQRINDEAKAHLQELRNNFDVESAELRLHMWSQEKQA